MCGPEEISELSIINSRIAIGVNSSDDCEELSLSCVVALALEEDSQVICVDDSAVVSVNRSESRHWGIVPPELKGCLQTVQPTLQINFLLNDFEQSSLNIKWQAFISTYNTCAAIECDVPLEVVSAWEKKLQETKDAKVN